MKTEWPNVMSCLVWTWPKGGGSGSLAVLSGMLDVVFGREVKSSTQCHIFHFLEPVVGSVTEGDGCLKVWHPFLASLVDNLFVASWNRARARATS